MEGTKIALIPAYDPDEKMVILNFELILAGFDVIIVDDGSKDVYQGFFDAAKGAVILHHSENRGKGAAIKTGLGYIQRNYTAPYTVVTLDADGQHTANDAKLVCERAEETGRPVLGVRSFKGEVPLKSRLGNRITSLVFLISTGMKVGDTQTGLRAFPARMLPMLCGIKGDRYEYEMNVLMELAQSRYEIEQVPIRTIYTDSRNSCSHFRPLRDSFRIYREILRFSASSLLCFGIDYILFCLFSSLLGSAAAANVTARIFSATANYELNRIFVFKKDRQGGSALGYFALALFVLAGNTLIIALLTSVPGISAYAAKLIAEICMFIVSFTVQKLFVFSSHKAAGRRVHT